MEKSSTYNQKKPRKLLDQVRDVMSLKHYAFSTERTSPFKVITSGNYIENNRGFIFCGTKPSPNDMTK
jgi:hypothetical protein